MSREFVVIKGWDNLPRPITRELIYSEYFNSKYVSCSNTICGECIFCLGREPGMLNCGMQFPEEIVDRLVEYNLITKAEGLTIILDTGK